MEASIKSLSTAVQQMSPATASGQSEAVVRQAVDAASKVMQQQLADFNAATSARLEQLSAVCTHLAQSVERSVIPMVTLPPPARTPLPADDRALNVVLYGVPEDRSVSVWRHIVDDALRHITDHDVDVVDSFRIGRYADGKVRPIIVKLHTAWDKRLLLIGCKKLKEFTQAKIFLSADLSLDERRKRTFDQLKQRAERDNKVVAVSNGILSIDNVQVYSLSSGKIN
jgi:hypothetical protein